MKEPCSDPGSMCRKKQRRMDQKQTTLCSLSISLLDIIGLSWFILFLSNTDFLSNIDRIKIGSLHPQKVGSKLDQSSHPLFERWHRPGYSDMSRDLRENRVRWWWVGKEKMMSETNTMYIHTTVTGTMERKHYEALFSRSV